MKDQFVVLYGRKKVHRSFYVGEGAWWGGTKWRTRCGIHLFAFDKQVGRSRRTKEAFDKNPCKNCLRVGEQ